MVEREKRCENCNFWDVQGDDGGIEGHCRKHAPRPIADIDHDPAFQSPVAYWQLTSRADWCGEHDPKPKPTHTTSEEYLL
jgi:hypothetical protein